MKRLLFLIPILFVSFVPSIADAQGLVTCSGIDCDFCKFATMVENVVNYITIILVIMSVIILAVTGIQMAVSSGDTDGLKLLKNRLTNVIIGFVLIIAGYTIVDTVIKLLVTDNTAQGKSIIDTWRTPLGDICAKSK